MRSRWFAVLPPLGLALAGCGGSSPAVAADASIDHANDAATDRATEARATGADANAADGYADDAPCQPGLPRCFGDFGYQVCLQDGTWGSSQTCAGYSMNGTTSFCAEIPMSSGGAWGTCVDPACWYWQGRGALGGATPVGVCQPDGTIDRCDSGGALSLQPCAGVCTQVATLDGRALGYCAPACEDGARECLGGPFYRTCANGRWGAPETCAAGACNPVATGAVPDTRCGGACDRGTSRCSADTGAIESCGDGGAWIVDRTCLLGRCVPAGAQAECETECTPGAHQCAFDGASNESLCDGKGSWGADSACATGTSCRISGNFALGCVACVGAGNAFGAADSRCDATGLATCNVDDQWTASVPCTAPQVCQTVTRGSSTVAACATP